MAVLLRFVAPEIDWQRFERDHRYAKRVSDAHYAKLMRKAPPFVAFREKHSGGLRYHYDREYRARVDRIAEALKQFRPERPLGRVMPFPALR